MKLKLGMIGGGEGSFIGPVHRMAAQLDGLIEIVSGAFSSDQVISLSSGLALDLDKDRIYASWQAMIQNEKALGDNKRPDIICIVTPNHLHYEQVLESLKAGFNVICDKPLCITLKEALHINKIVDKQGLAFCITHNYSGYPMVKKAREMVRGGSIGRIRKVYCEYLQSWLSEKEEERGNRQAEWRTDPSRAGISGCMADIGTHAFQLSEYITGKRVTNIFGRLNNIVEGRTLDDDGAVLTEMEDKISGTLIASQVAMGEENGLRIRIYGTKGSIYWEQMSPNSLVLRWKDRPMEIHRTAAGYENSSGIADMHSRLPAGHPEGFIEAFANLYRNFALDILARKQNKDHDSNLDYPGINDAVRGMAFLEAVVNSSSENRWKSLEHLIQ